MKNNQIATRPLAIIEAKFDLEAKQNDIIDMLFTQLRHDDNKLEYEINIERYKNYYTGDTSNIYRDLKKAVKMFENNKGVTISDRDTGQETWYSWFSKITYLNREGKILVRLDSEFKGILTEVKRRISYDIENTLKCASKYSKRLYYYLKTYEDTGWRIDTLEDLREKLKTPASYKDYGKLKEKVLDVASREINSLTDIGFDYEAIKEGRKVVRIKFTIKTKRQNIIKEIHSSIMENTNYPVLSVTKNEISRIVGDRVDLKESNNYKNLMNALNKGYNKSTFKNKTDIKGYLQLTVEYIDDYVKRINKDHNYLALLISGLNNDYIGNAEKKNISNNKPTLRDNKNIEQKQLRFNDFTQREYDYDALEDMLLGNIKYDGGKLPEK